MATKTRDKGEGSVFPYRNIYAATMELPPGPDGRRRQKWFYSKKKSAVVKKLNDAKKHLAEHGDLPTSSVTLEKWVAKWLTEIAPKNLNPNTLRSYRSSLTHHVVPRLGKRRLDRLQPGAIREALQQIAEEKSTGTAKNAYSYLRACLRDAVTDGAISRHPMEHFKPPKVTRKDANALDVEQAVYLLQWLTRRMDDPQRADGLEPLWITYLLTGERRNEVLGLEKDRITEVLDVCWQLQRHSEEAVASAPVDWEYRHLQENFYLVRPKSSKSWREFPNIEPLASILAQQAKWSAHPSLVFSTPEGKPWDPDGITARWSKMLAEAGIEKHDGPLDDQTAVADRVTLHGARHTVVDLLYLLEVPEALIMEIVGHSSRQVTRGYKSKNSAAVKKAVTKMVKLLQGGESYE